MMSCLGALPGIKNKTYWVATNGSDSNNGRLPTSPFLTPQKARNTAAPGDVVTIMPGSYGDQAQYQSSFYGESYGMSGGSVGRWITMQGQQGGSQPYFLAGNTTSSSNQAINAYSPYMRVVNVWLDGPVQTVSRSSAQNAGWSGTYGNYSQPWSGVGVRGNTYSTNSSPNNTHHLMVKFCTLSNWGCSGITTFGDYMFTIGNNLFNNSWYSGYAGSNISQSVQTFNDANGNNTQVFDTLPGFHIIIAENRSYRSAEYVDNYGNNQGNPGPISDGEGIIIDTGTAGMPTLVASNLCVGNGSSGIEVFVSPNVTVTNNTTYNNGINTGSGMTGYDGQTGGYSGATVASEIVFNAYNGSVANTGGVVTNNVVYNIQGGGNWSGTGTNTSIATSDSNSSNGGSINGTNATTGAVLFASPNPTDGGNYANFILGASSPARGTAGKIIYGRDINGRSLAVTKNRGAIAD